ncbi:MAG: class I SAM-dependent methyltransferase [Proteobacteria bacterium]|nr:class I SAM-dependent methyltransferase [Pseudomonadota bacterium]
MATPTLAAYREKWREAPRGSDADGRVFSTDLLAMADDAFLAAWQQMAARRYAGEVGWLGPLYFDTFRGKNVAELGPGLGYDGVRFAEHGAHWTFCDIVPDNLAVIRRITTLKGLSDRVHFHLIGDDLSFDALPRDFDAIWVFGSIHHVPFEIARKEALDLLGHLKPGGRWMELVYPRERWLREGAPPFEQWGKLTDGERTPWAEWHDIEKVRRRLFPAPLRTLLDFEFCSHNYRWFDMVYAAERPFRAEDHDVALLSRRANLLQAPVTLNRGARRQWLGPGVVCAPGLFAPSAGIDLGPSMRAVTGAAKGLPGFAVDIECRVGRGAVGIGLVDANGAYLPDAEASVEEGPDSRLVTLRAVGTGVPAKLVVRNLRASGRSIFHLVSATLRPAN